MIRKITFLPLVLAVLFLGGCETASTQQSAVATTDTATEVALFGLVSWANRPDPDDSSKLQVFALMPSTTNEHNQLKKPQCLGDERPPMQHYPVLKLVTYGSYSWMDNKALPDVSTNIFSIAGQDVTIQEEDGFDTLSREDFDLLSSDARLENLRSGDYTNSYQVKLDEDLLESLQDGDPRLATRVLFTRGKVTAKISTYCKEYEPLYYLAEANTAGPGSTGCPDEGKASKELAEEVVARLSETGQPLTVHFREWGGTAKRTLVVQPGTSGGVRIELSHQMKEPAKHFDSRDDHFVMCKPEKLADYLWYYDLRAPAKEDCADLRPAFFPCILKVAGGTKCPEHDWGP